MKLAKLESMAATGWIPSWRSLVYSSSETWRGAARALEDSLYPIQCLQPQMPTVAGTSHSNAPQLGLPWVVTGQENTILPLPSYSQPTAPPCLGPPSSVTASPC